MRSTLLNRSAGTLSTEIEYANWEFYGKTLTVALKPIQNVDSFYEAFDIKEDQKLYLKPEDRVRIW